VFESKMYCFRKKYGSSGSLCRGYPFCTLGFPKRFLGIPPFVCANDCTPLEKLDLKEPFLNIGSIARNEPLFFAVHSAVNFGVASQ